MSVVGRGSAGQMGGNRDGCVQARLEPMHGQKSADQVNRCAWLWQQMRGDRDGCRQVSLEHVHDLESAGQLSGDRAGYGQRTLEPAHDQ